ncbi:MAG TPA: class I SAM-dependent methyltransferase, partial [Burkholderiaceae bacterium]
MANASSHEEQVNRQFGQSAAAYLSSSAHAQGADLQRLAQLLQGRHEAQVLDVGCGAGHVSFAVAPQVGQVTAYDLSPQMLGVVAQEAARRGLHNIVTKRGVAEQLPFADAAFDCVLTRFSAHHWSDLAASLNEVRRVLKPGGRFFAIDVMAPGEPLFDTHLQCVELLRDVSHVRNYSHAQWQQQLHAAGFAVEADSRWKLPLEFQ